MNKLFAILFVTMLVSSASAQYIPVTGGGTITLGQSANIVVAPASGVINAYELIENGVVVQTVGTFGTGGQSTDVGRPHTFKVTPSALGTYVYSARVQATIFRGGYIAPSSNSVTLTVVATPVNHAPTVVWNAPSGAVNSGQSYSVSAHGHDGDGNLTQVNVWKNNQPFAFGGGGNGTDADSGNSTTDTGPQTVTFTAQAVDSAGAMSALITQTVTVAAPPPVQFTLTTVAGAGGSVSPGGVFLSGASVTATATPDAVHDFAGWSGDAGGLANPCGIVMDRNKTVQGNFVLKNFPLTTSAGSGGSVTPGGLYPFGTIVTIAATADSTHYFSGWTGDASGATPSVAVTIDRAKSVQAQFAAMAVQTIFFPPPGDHPAGVPAFALVATASSGLPVTFTVLSGPAAVTGNLIQVAGPGTVAVQADQPGDAFTLAAPPVTQNFNVTTALILKYRAPARTLLQSSQNPATVPYLIQP